MFTGITSFMAGNAKFTAAVATGTTIAIIPIAGTIFEFTNRQKEYLFREFVMPIDETNNNNQKKNITFNDFSLIKYSYKDLIKGTKDYNNGNYVLYFGSELCPYCNIMMYGIKNNKLTDEEINNKFDKYKQGSWFHAYKFIKQSKEMEQYNLKFLFFSDSYVSEDKTKIDSFPWALHDPENPNSFKRQDKNAIDFRKIRTAAQKNFKSEKVSSIPTVIVYKEGAPKIFGEDKFDLLEPYLKMDSADINSAEESSKSQYDSSIKNWLTQYIYYYFEGNVLMTGTQAPAAKAK